MIRCRKVGDDRLSAERINSKFVRKGNFSRRELAKKVILFVAPLAILLIVVTLFTQSSYLDIKEVQVKKIEGEDFVNLDVARLEERLAVEVKGQKLFRLNIPSTEKLVKESSPFVKNVYVEKVFPDGLEISIEERVPSLLIQTRDICVVLDPENVVLDLEASGQGGDEVLVEDSESTDQDAQNASIYFDCDSLKGKYQVMLLKSTEIKADFVVGEDSKFYDSEKLLLFERVVRSQGYEVSDVLLAKDVYTATLLPDRKVYFSSQQDIEIQIKRFILISEQIDIDDLDFKTLDLRYERPILIEP